MRERISPEKFSKPRILRLLMVCAVDVVRGYLQKSDQYPEEVKRLYLTRANNLQTLLNSILDAEDLNRWPKEYSSPFSISPILIIGSESTTRLVEVGEMSYPKSPLELITYLEYRIELEDGAKLEENQKLISLIIHFGPLSSQVLHELKLLVESKKRLAPTSNEIKQKCLKALKIEVDDTSIGTEVVGGKVDLFIKASVFTSEEWESFLFTHK